jgi:hypothetical protein
LIPEPGRNAFNTRNPSLFKSLWIGAGASLLYMGVLWISFSHFDKAHFLGRWVGLMSISFLFLTPFATGALINWAAPPAERGRLPNLLVKPVSYAFGAFLIALVIKIEGIICALMAFPAFAILASLGAVAFHLFTKDMAPGPTRKSAVAFLLLPILAAPVESRFQAGALETTTLSQIEIAAPRNVIWKNIIRVPRIAKSEIPLGLSVLMGFPDPVEATLSREGVGGIRRASFEGNVLFTETIDAWDEGRMLSFSIAANTEEIPPETMDEHMIVGGDYFNVLRGTYAIEDLGGGRCLLKLSSRHAATTDFNLYADLWGRLLMGDIQDRILKVVRARCERGFVPGA